MGIQTRHQSKGFHMPIRVFLRHWILYAFFLSGCGKAPGPVEPEAKKAKDAIILIGKVRDFHEGNATSSDGTHPHFNQNPVSCDARTLGVRTVEPNLDTTAGADPKFPGDNRGPALILPVDPAISKCFDPPDRFGDWFQDRGTDINRPFLVKLPFTLDASAGIYFYRNNAFFPIDEGADYVKESEDGPEPFGHLQTGAKDTVDLTRHNYGFTMEFHTRFTYEQGQGQFIAFAGDDDLWAFVNGKRVIDLGGTHSTQKDTVKLDDLKDALGLTDKGDGLLDFFFAERSVASSNLSIATNVAFRDE
jgi:fibro-slime domain-containing protein